MVTDHEMRMEALRLFEENERLRAALEEILATTGEDESCCRGIAARARALPSQDGVAP